VGGQAGGRLRRIPDSKKGRATRRLDLYVKELMGNRSLAVVPSLVE